MGEIEALTCQRDQLVTREALRQVVYRGSDGRVENGTGSGGGAGSTPASAQGASPPRLRSKRDKDRTEGAALSDSEAGIVQDVDEPVLSLFIDSVMKDGGPATPAGPEERAEASADASDDGPDPAHERLVALKLDPRVYNPLLLSIKHAEPALYRAILSHPLVSGRAKSRRRASNLKARRKAKDKGAGKEKDAAEPGVERERCDRDRERDKSREDGDHQPSERRSSASLGGSGTGGGAEGSGAGGGSPATAGKERGGGSGGGGSGRSHTPPLVPLQPDFQSEPLDSPTAEAHVSAFVAKAVLDGGLQSALIAVKLLLCTFLKTSAGAPPPQLPPPPQQQQQTPGAAPSVSAMGASEVTTPSTSRALRFWSAGYVNGSNSNSGGGSFDDEAVLALLEAAEGDERTSATLPLGAILALLLRPSRRFSGPNPYRKYLAKAKAGGRGGATGTARAREPRMEEIERRHLKMELLRQVAAAASGSGDDDSVPDDTELLAHAWALSLDAAASEGADEEAAGEGDAGEAAAGGGEGGDAAVQNAADGAAAADADAEAAAAAAAGCAAADAEDEARSDEGDGDGNDRSVNGVETAAERSEADASSGRGGRAPTTVAAPAPAAAPPAGEGDREPTVEAAAASVAPAAILRLKEFFAPDAAPAEAETGGAAGGGVGVGVGPQDLGAVPVEAVVLSLLAHLDGQSTSYMRALSSSAPASSGAGRGSGGGTPATPAEVSPPPPPAVHAHAVSFMLLHSLLQQLLAELSAVMRAAAQLEAGGDGSGEAAAVIPAAMASSGGGGGDGDPASEITSAVRLDSLGSSGGGSTAGRKGPRGQTEHFLWRRGLFLSAAAVSTLRTLEANVWHVVVSGISPGMVGLGLTAAGIGAPPSSFGGGRSVSGGLPSSRLTTAGPEGIGGLARAIVEGILSPASHAVASPEPASPATGESFSPRLGGGGGALRSGSYGPAGTPTASDLVSPPALTSPPPALGAAAAESPRADRGLFVHRLRFLLEDCMACCEPKALRAVAIVRGGSSGGEPPTRENCLRFIKAAGSAALDVWSRGLTLFYPQHHQRHALLMNLLETVPLHAGRRAEDTVVTCRRRQLDALCARLAEPELVEGFVVDLIPPEEGPETGGLSPPSPMSTPVPRRSLAGASAAAGAAAGGAARWSDAAASSSPAASATAAALESLSVSLLSGTVTREGLLERMRALLAGGPGQGALQPSRGPDAGVPGPAAAAAAAAAAAGGPTPSLTGEESVQRLCSAVAAGKSVSAEYVAALRGTETPRENQRQAEQALKLVLTTLVGRLSHLPAASQQAESGGAGSGAPEAWTREGSFVAELELLMAVQRQVSALLLRSPNGETEQSAPRFDARKSSDNIVLSDGGRTATQRQSKSWGSALALAGCPPGTGIYRWLVHLDRCEKGHVFIGVCSGSASTATYVGGDHHGWGLIGTRALWHNRSKVRGDYGDGFGTGSLVHITLDTDRGTLSFGPGHPSSSNGGGGGDWGLAFENLPKTEVLYPAVGLYQRDDQITLLPCESARPAAMGAAFAAVAGFARPGGSTGLALAVAKAITGHEAALAYVRALVSAVTSLVERGRAILKPASRPQRGRQDRDGAGLDAAVEQELRSCLCHPLVTTVLPALAAALLLMRRAPFVGGYLAAQLLPHLTNLLKLVDATVFSLRGRSRSGGGLSTPGGSSGVGSSATALIVNVSGTWRIRSAEAEGIQAQEYVLELESSLPAADGTDLASLAPCMLRGHGNGGTSAVTVTGTVAGLRVVFLERWKQGGTCTVEGRLAFDGSAFFGTFKDTRSGTRGPIEGFRVEPPAGHATSNDSMLTQLVRLETVLGMLSGKLTSTFAAAIDVDVSALVVGPEAAGAAGGSDAPAAAALLALPAAPSSRNIAAPAGGEPAAAQEPAAGPGEEDEDEDDSIEDEDDEDGEESPSETDEGPSGTGNGGHTTSDGSGDEDEASSGWSRPGGGGGSSQARAGGLGVSGSIAGGGSVGGSGGSSSGIDSETAELVAYWRRSQLLSGGLTWEETKPFVVAALQLFAPEGDDAYVSRWRAAVMPWLDAAEAGAAATERQAAAPHSSDEGGAPSGTGGPKFLDPMYEELRAGRGDGAKLDRWVQRHLGAAPLSRLGGEPMAAARRTVAAAILLHSGCLQQCRAELAAAATAGDAAEEVRPGERTLQVWRAARQVTESAMRSRQTSGASFAVIADLLHAKADFLLRVRPCAAAAAVAFASEGTPDTGVASMPPLSLTSVDGQPVPLPSAPGANSAATDEAVASLVLQATRFLQSKLRRVFPLRCEMLRASVRAVLRAVGLRSTLLLLGRCPAPHPAHGTGGKGASASSGRSPLRGLAIGADTGDAWDRDLQLQAGVAATVQFLPAALQCREPAVPGLPTPGGAAYHRVVTEDSELYYMDGLEGCTAEVADAARAAWERLLQQLAQLLQRAVWSADADAQLVLLQTWGLAIQPRDHLFLSRVGIFRTLQLVIEEARSSLERLARARAAAVTTAAAAPAEGGGMNLEDDEEAGSGSDGDDEEGRSDASGENSPAAGDADIRGELDGEDAAGAALVTALAKAGPFSGRLTQAARQRVVRSALKVVHLLAAQVAFSDVPEPLPGPPHVSSTPTGPLPGPVRSWGSPAGGAVPRSPVPMTRTPSGPETLSRSLFDMLHSELLYALCQLSAADGPQGARRSAANAPNAAAAAATAGKCHHGAAASGRASPNGEAAAVARTDVHAGWAEYEPDAGSGEMTPHRYCYRILGLVHSVSGSAVCQRYLSSTAWLRLLLGGVVTSPPAIQRRLLRLLRRLLPAVDPEGSRIDCRPPGGLLARLANDESSGEAQANSEPLLGAAVASLMLECVASSLVAPSLASALCKGHIDARSAANANGGPPLSPTGREEAEAVAAAAAAGAGDASLAGDPGVAGQCGYLSPLGTEAVLLLRRLQDVGGKWASAVNAELLASLRGGGGLLDPGEFDMEGDYLEGDGAEEAEEEDAEEAGEAAEGASGSEADSPSRPVQADEKEEDAKDQDAAENDGEAAAAFESGANQQMTVAEASERERRWRQRREQAKRVLAATSVLGGYIDGLRIGGVVMLRPSSVAALSESLALRLAAAPNTAGIVVSLDNSKRTAECALVELEAKGATLGPGNSVRPLKIGYDEVLPIAEVPVALEATVPEAAAAVLEALTDHGLAWLERKLDLMSGPAAGANAAADGEAGGGVGDAAAQEDAMEAADDDEAAVDRAMAGVDAEDSQAAPGSPGTQPGRAEGDETSEPVEGDANGTTAMVLEDVGEAWRCEDGVFQAGIAVQTFRSASVLLSHKAFGAALLRADQEGKNGRSDRLARLLQVATIATDTGGLPSIERLEDAWLELWNEWHADSVHRVRRVLAPDRDTAGGGRGWGGGGGGDGDGGGGDEAQERRENNGQMQREEREGGGNGAPAAAESAAVAAAAATQAYAAAAAAALGLGTIMTDTGAAVAKMMEMGFPKGWCEVALRRTGNNLEQAVNFCFEHSAEMEQLMAEEQAAAASAAAAAALHGGSGRTTESVRRSLESSLFMKQLVDMGFPPSWCQKALAANRNNVDAALTWILSRGEALAAEDLEEDEEAANRAEEEARGGAGGGDGGAGGPGDGDGGGGGGGAETAEEDEDERILNPLRVVSGVADLRRDLTAEGVPAGGFASVGARGCLVSSGKWYYEATLRTAGCMQLGWADASYQGNAESGDGVGDGPHSWAYDGWRQFKWHDRQTPWGARWAPGDVVGCAVDVDKREMSFFLNGRGLDIGMGVAFQGFAFAGGLFPCASFNRHEQLQFNFGGRPFGDRAPPGYRPFIEAVAAQIDKDADMLCCMGLDAVVSGGMDPASALVRPSPDFYGLEDALECETGAEAYLPHTRYFAPDAPSSSGTASTSAGGGSASTNRGGGGGSGGGAGMRAMEETRDAAGRGSRRAPLTPQGNNGNTGGTGPGLSDEEYHAMVEQREQLVALAADLCVLYVRRAVLTLLARWPTKEIGRGLELRDLCGAGADEGGGYEGQRSGDVGAICLVRLLALASAEGPASRLHMAALQLQQPNGVVNDPVAGASRLALPVVLQALHAGGMPALRLVAGSLAHAVAVAAVSEAHSESIASPLLRELAQIVGLTVLAAAGRDYALQLASGAWRVAGESQGAAALLGGGRGAATYDSSATDHDALGRPNLSLATWITSVLLNCPQQGTATSGIMGYLFCAWSIGLRSPNVTLKLMAASIVSAVLQGMAFACDFGGGGLPRLLPLPLKPSLTMAGDAATPQHGLRPVFEVVAAGLALLPAKRVHALALRRLWTERSSHPIYSRYLQGLVELSTALRLVAKHGVKEPAARAIESAERAKGKETGGSGESTGLEAKDEAKEAAAAEAVADAVLCPYETITDPSMPPALPEAPEEWKNAATFCREWDEGLVMSDGAWETWSGRVVQRRVRWEERHSRRSAQAIVAGRAAGAGASGAESSAPPLLQPGCYVIKGPDWDSAYPEPQNAPKDEVEEEAAGKEDAAATTAPVPDTATELTQEPPRESTAEVEPAAKETPPSPPSTEAETPPPPPPQLAETQQQAPVTPDAAAVPAPPPPPPRPVVGVVEAIVPYKDAVGMGRRVRWPDGTVRMYRWGADGCVDLCHVEVSSCGPEMTVTTRYPPPETREDHASRRGFGQEMRYGVILRLRPAPPGLVSPATVTADVGGGDGGGKSSKAPKRGEAVEGTLEWPDFCATVYVRGRRLPSGGLHLREEALLSGAADAGWGARFADDGWRPGVEYNLSACRGSGVYSDGEDAEPGRHLRGTFSYDVKLGGRHLRLLGDMRLGQADLFTLDRHAHSPNVTVSTDGRIATCSSSDCRGCVVGTVGFSRGVHYWEVKVVQGEPGCVFIGVLEKLGPPGPGALPRLTRWQGWGFVNYRAAYHNTTEKTYGDHFHAGDTVGVRLDMEKGTLSFFLDGMKYGQHVVSDLGVAFDGLTDGRPTVRPRTLFPCFGFRKTNDRITLTGKWLSSPGTHPATALADAAATAELLHSWERGGRAFAAAGAAVAASSSVATAEAPLASPATPQPEQQAAAASFSAESSPAAPASVVLPTWLYRDAWQDFGRWRRGRWRRVATRADPNLPIDMDRSPRACAEASVRLGLRSPLFSGDRVRMARSCGRALEVRESAAVLGALGGRLFCQADTQRSEASAGDTNLAWCLLQCDVEGMEVESRAPGMPEWAPTVPLAPAAVSRGGWLRVVYEGGAVMRDGVEIDSSEQLGALDRGAVVWAMERRINSSNVARYLVSHGGIAGWVSERIRGNDEELIMQRISAAEAQAAGAPPPPPGAEAEAAAAEAADGPDGGISASVKAWEAAVLARGDEGRAWLEGGDQGGGGGQALLADLDEFPAFLALASAAGDAGEPWTAEMDMQLTEAVNELCDYFGEAPQNLSFAELRRGLLERDAGSTTAAAAAAGTAAGDGVAKNIGGSALSTGGDMQVEAAAAAEAAGNHVAAVLSGKDREALAGVTAARLLARMAVLRAFNARVGRALPLLCLALPEEDWERHAIGASSVISVAPARPPPATNALAASSSFTDAAAAAAAATGGSSSGSGSSGSGSVVASAEGWRPLCTARRLRALRRLVFTHTKRTFWEGVLTATTTPTPPHHDEYEDPREIRLIRVNRVRATPARLGALQNVGERLRHSVFGQLHREMRAWPGTAFRRAYVGKGHGGQRRAFKVKFMGEGVNDYGGPYRAVFEQVADELQCDQLPAAVTTASGGGGGASRGGGGRCLLPLLVPCPNRAAGVGVNQDKFMLSPSLPGAAALMLVHEPMQLLGRLAGMAVRHGLQMGLDLPAMVWRPLVGLPLARPHLAAVDALATKALDDVRAAGEAAEAAAVAAAAAAKERGASPEEAAQAAAAAAAEAEPPEWEELTFSTHVSDLTRVPLRPGGEAERVTLSNWREYVALAENARLCEAAPLLKAFREGLGTSLPTELFPLFTAKELERLVCGVRRVDVDLLRQCTEYEDVDSEASHVKAFWEVMQEMRSDERTAFLRFVWARSRMPVSAKDFPMSFKIQGPQGGARDAPDAYLPHAQTCFFSLSLPAYTDKEILRRKLLFAIANSPNMDADVRLHTGEGWADA